VARPPTPSAPIHGALDDDRSPDSPQIASTMAAAAATALPPKVAFRFHFHHGRSALASLVAGTLVSSQKAVEHLVHPRPQLPDPSRALA